MTEHGTILIADDEETFLQSTADLLRQEGYTCDCAPDAATAERMLRDRRYHLIIADIRMPGNADLEFIRELPRIAEAVPVILVTGYPSLRTAIQSIHLPVAAYLTKPVDLAELKEHVRTAIQNSHLYRSVSHTRQRLEDSCRQLANFEELLKKEARPWSAPGVNTFVELSFMNVLGAVSDLKHLTDALGLRDIQAEACRLLNCPRLHALTRAIATTIEVLEHTRGSFKSKELGELRKKLEKLLEGNPKTNPSTNG